MKALKLLSASALALIVLLAATLFIQVAKAEPHSPALVLETCIPSDGTFSDIPAPTHEIQVLRSSTCLGIEQREPSQTAAEFDLSDERIYFFSEIQLPKGEPISIKHVWKHEGKVASVVSLKVLGPNFRTWSYKSISESHTGEWTVEVQTESGDILESSTFYIN